MYRLPYGQDVVLDFPLIDAGAQAFEATPVTIAAGDVKVLHDRLIATNPSGETVAFTSGGTYEIQAGDTVTGATSTETAVIIGVRITSGTWAGGDAAGFLFVRDASGVFQSENLNVGANLNVATIGGDLDGAALFKHLGGGMYAVGIPGSQLAGARGWVKVQDQTATEEWEDTVLLFETFGHERAADPQGCVWTGTGHSSGQSVSAIVIAGTASAPASAPASGFYFEVVSGTGAGQAGFVETVAAATNTTITPYVNLNTAIDATSTVKFYRAARQPSHIVTAESNLNIGGGGTTRTSF